MTHIAIASRPAFRRTANLSRRALVSELKQSWPLPKGSDAKLFNSAPWRACLERLWLSLLPFFGIPMTTSPVLLPNSTKLASAEQIVQTFIAIFSCDAKDSPTTLTPGKPYVAQTPPSLLQRLREHPEDAEAWQRFDSLYRPLLQTWLRRYSIRPQDADDLVQQVLEVVVREMPHFHYDAQKGKFRSWLRG